MKRHIVHFTILATVMTGLIGCSTSITVEDLTIDEPEAATALVVEEGQKQIRVSITGMTCPEGCPPAVEALLQGVPGIAAVGAVDYENRLVDCAVDPTQFDATKVAEVFNGTVFEGSAVQN